MSKKKKFREEFAGEEEAFNDFFRIGLSVNWSKAGKMSLKLYEQFYASDIIVASPLALRLLCGHKVDSKANDMTEKIDQDFLSSIEFLVMDQSEAFIYQNLEHLEEVLKALNQRPKKLTQLNDISRLFEIYTEKPAKQHSMYAPLFRQTLSIHKF